MTETPASTPAAIAALLDRLDPPDREVCSVPGCRHLEQVVGLGPIRPEVTLKAA